MVARWEGKGGQLGVSRLIAYVLDFACCCCFSYSVVAIRLCPRRLCSLLDDDCRREEAKASLWMSGRGGH